MKNIKLLAVLTLLLMSCQKDDDTIASCEKPTNISANSITSTSATIFWSDNNDDGTNGASMYTFVYGNSGFNVNIGNQIPVIISDLTINPDGGFYALSDLAPNTTYDVYVKRNCSTQNESMYSEVFSFTTLAAPVETEFRATLSQMNLFQGNLGDLIPSPYAFEYALHSTLYTDYAAKQRFIVLPEGETMHYTNDKLPEFPDNTVVAKTFYYNNDDRNLNLGKQIIETRVMIKRNGVWDFGDYVWNSSQTDATLDPTGSTQPVSWIDATGTTQNINYKIPSQENCFTCHQSNSQPTLIGPKLRSMNFDVNGVNQLQKFINEGYLVNSPNPSSISVLPDWKDTTLSDEVRVRAYMDINCAHCHSSGGFHNVTYYEALKLEFETSFDNSLIYNERYSIMARIQTSVEGYSMPYLGVSTPHSEAVELIVNYLESLD